MNKRGKKCDTDPQRKKTVNNLVNEHVKYRIQHTNTKYKKNACS